MKNLEVPMRIAVVLGLLALCIPPCIDLSDPRQPVVFVPLFLMGLIPYDIVPVYPMLAVELAGIVLLGRLAVAALAAYEALGGGVRRHAARKPARRTLSRQPNVNQNGGTVCWNVCQKINPTNDAFNAAP